MVQTRLLSSLGQKAACMQRIFEFLLELLTVYFLRESTPSDDEHESAIVNLLPYQADSLH